MDEDYSTELLSMRDRLQAIADDLATDPERQEAASDIEDLAYQLQTIALWL